VALYIGLAEFVFNYMRWMDVLKDELISTVAVVCLRDIGA